MRRPALSQRRRAVESPASRDSQSCTPASPRRRKGQSSDSQSPLMRPRSARRASINTSPTHERGCSGLPTPSAFTASSIRSPRSVACRRRALPVRARPRSRRTSKRSSPLRRKRRLLLRLTCRTPDRKASSQSRSASPPAPRPKPATSIRPCSVSTASSASSLSCRRETRRLRAPRLAGTSKRMRPLPRAMGCAPSSAGVSTSPWKISSGLKALQLPAR